jgi:NAD+ kinase
MPASMNLQSVLVLAHPSLPDATEHAAQISKHFQAQGIASAHGLLYDEAQRQKLKDGKVDLLIALGGDGTMLRAGNLCAPNNVPILGINMGRFGFLTEIQLDQWHEVIPRLFSGDYWLERRMMLRAELWRAGELQGSWEVLNEVAVSRGHIVRPVHLVASVDGRYLTTYVADALIAATATGSTAYALAAGGPVLPPELRNILLVAVAPHLSIDRAIVLADGSSVSITVNTDHEASLSPDGQAPINLADGDTVNACASEHSENFVRFQDPGYFYRNLTPHMNQNPITGNPR